jgi:hypothetical protein
MQQPNERGQKDQQWSPKLKIEIHEPSYNPYNELTNWQWYNQFDLLPLKYKGPTIYILGEGVCFSAEQHVFFSTRNKYVNRRRTGNATAK